ncbi:MAG: TonB-dependent receptor [Verrucomicrobia bacterium]|nr:TonB-dependent receptor [Verrucomicrobiota bacterium]
MTASPTLVSHRLRAGLALLLTAGSAWAGELAGVVTQAASQGYLPGATVTLVELGRSESTDSGGAFRFSEVPAGTYTLQVLYVGYETRSESVRVPATGTTTVAIGLGEEIVRLQQFVVEGFMEGRARALQQKRTQTNISDIISADAIGNLPDRNVAEAVSRLAGVNLSLDQGEGRYVSIRGVEPNLNQVLLDDATLAAPGGTRLGRATPLDTLGASQIAQIEVVKSATPDLDANSLGGTLKIKSASPFDRKGRFFSGSANGLYNETSEKTNLDAQVSYSTQFGRGNRWGILAGASYDKRFFENNWVQASWNQRVIGTESRWLPNDFQVKPENGSNERYGANFNLEYRPNDSLRLFVRPNFSFASSYENRYETNISIDNSPARVTFATPTSGTFAGAGARTERRELRRQYDQDLFTISAGLRKAIGPFTLEPLLTHSAAKEDRVYDKSREFRNATGATGPVQFDFSRFDFVRWDVDPNIDAPATYPLRRTRDDWGIVDEKTSTAKFDLRWDSHRLLGHPGWLKTGVKYLQRSRITDFESRRVEPVTSWRLDSSMVQPAVPVYDGRFNSGFRLNWEGINRFIAANPAQVRPILVEEAQNSIEDDYDIDEYIYAAYAMGSIRLNRLTLLGGVRWEKTDATIRAVEARQAGTVLLGRFPTAGTTSYDRFFPNLQAVYRFNDHLLLRSAITRTIGRPAYEDSRPLSNFRYDFLGAAALNPAFPYTGTLSIGNPQLRPYQATNYDLSLEWYRKGSATVALAAFRKEVDDPIYTYSEVLRDTTHSGIGLQTLGLSSRRNADRGTISGLELTVYLPFKFLPAPFDGFGIDGNVTRITSDVKVPTRVGEDLPFFRQPSKIYNLTAFYEKGRFSGRVAWSFADEQLYSIGTTTYNDQYRRSRGQYDVLFRYRISSHYSIMGSVRNLTREPEQFRYGIKEPTLLRSSRLLDRDYKLGVSFNY